jgi:transposase-like protein
MQGSSSSSRWTADDRIRIVMESLTTNIILDELCRKYNLKPNVFYGWKQKFIEGGSSSLLIFLHTFLNLSQLQPFFSLLWLL